MTLIRVSSRVRGSNMSRMSVHVRVSIRVRVRVSSRVINATVIGEAIELFMRFNYYVAAT